MSLKNVFHEVRLLFGIERNTTSHGEKWISVMGAAFGISAVYWISCWTFPHGISGNPGTLVMVASTGASAVLLFAAPQAAFSQPWAVIGGSLLSAFVGVSCQKIFPDQTWTPALAVGLAIAAMQYSRCMHPPGGAASLVAVIGGSGIHELGYRYVLAPVLINVLAVLLAAVAFSALFPWRRYPWRLATRSGELHKNRSAAGQLELTQEDLSAAMHEFHSYADITSENLTDLLERAQQRAAEHIPRPSEIVPGRFYSNGKLGALWSVRQVVGGFGEAPGPKKNQVCYKVLAGVEVGKTDICLRSEFRQWARFEVERHPDGRWEKKSASKSGC